VLWGTHVDPDVAYRFARGEPVDYLGEEVKRSTPPLDFLAVTDHSEYIGVFNTLDDPNNALSRSDIATEVHKQDPKVWSKLARLLNGEPLPGVDTRTVTQSAWQREIEAANRNYQPGKFTTFIAYEWTSSPGQHNLHRNVIFRGDKAPNPFSCIDSLRPEDLWAFLESIRKQGYEALAIPHNSNLSNGLMYDWVDSNGRSIDQAYAELRAANEPLAEISQIKGQSETHPLLSPNDEFSSFEVLDLGIKPSGGSYLRNALARGLLIAEHTGVNPYKYGFVGASDSHNGLSDSAERAYAGTEGAIPIKMMPDLNKYVQRMALAFGTSEGRFTKYMYATSSGNLTGVWAEENTRESIFAALRRKETFATSGTRLKFRFFGGWEYERGLLNNKDWVKEAYRLGAAMGGDLPRKPAGRKAPKFAIWAVKDPAGANLDRLQVVKVWVENGKHVEKIWDVALSNGRAVDPKTGRAPPVGNTVDLLKATYTNTIGATEFETVWEDPQFDQRVPAFYYLRVLEIPTPRWATIASVRLGQSLREGIPATIQERGWSSPIWYTPATRRRESPTKPAYGE